MSLEWIHENPPHWDDPKSRIVGAVPKGSFQIDPHTEGDLISGESQVAERQLMTRIKRMQVGLQPPVVLHAIGHGVADVGDVITTLE